MLTIVAIANPRFRKLNFFHYMVCLSFFWYGCANCFKMPLKILGMLEWPLALRTLNLAWNNINYLLLSCINLIKPSIFCTLTLD
jgi:hypothetical protein